MNNRNCDIITAFAKTTRALPEKHRAKDLPSSGARRMAESAALLVDDVLPHEPMSPLGNGY